MAAVGVASAGAQYAGQRQQARQQQRYQAQASAAERQRFLQEQSALRMREAQEQEAMNAELRGIKIKSWEEIERAGVAADQAGVSRDSLSLKALLDDYTRQEADYRVALTQQQEFRNINTGLALTDAEYRTMNNQIGINKPVSAPSWLSGGLGVVRQGVEGYADGMRIKKAMNS
jgi:hypothetical protein